MVELFFPEIFDMVKTFECGQIFRFESNDSGKTYYGALRDRIIKITQKDPHTLIFSSNNNSNLEKHLKSFFRTNDNYLDMQKSITIDNLMKKVVNFKLAALAMLFAIIMLPASGHGGQRGGQGQHLPRHFAHCCLTHPLPVLGSRILAQ